MTDQDERFTAAILAALPPVTAAPGLHQRLLAGFDDHQFRRGWLVRVADAIWPGAPVWAPGAALAAALLMGVGIGVALPDPANGSRGFSLQETASFSLVEPSESL